jgi:hypothetical protein
LGRDKAHVVAVLPRGEAIRNFVQTGALDVVASRARLSVFSVVPDSTSLEDLSERYERVIALEEQHERYPVRILRELLDMAHGRQLWSAAAQARWGLRDAEAAGTIARLKRAAKKMAVLPFANSRGVHLLEKWERIASRALRTTDEYQRLYEKLGPTLVFNGSHVHSQIATQAIEAAHWAGIPTAAFIFSWDNLTSQGRIRLLPGLERRSEGSIAGDLSRHPSGKRIHHGHPSVRFSFSF